MADEITATAPEIPDPQEAPAPKGPGPFGRLLSWSRQRLAACLRSAKRLRLSVFNWLSDNIRDIIHWTALLFIGIGMGLWVHPGAGLFAMGGIVLSLGVYANIRQANEAAEARRRMTDA